jgi:curved DNA-binding protein CbpA
MFIDYYTILGLNKNATPEQIKKRFKELAKKYHPDVNKDSNATQLMQELLEAYYILSDLEARIRYDIQYDRYYNQQNSSSYSTKTTNAQSKENKTKQDFKFNDPIIEKWIINAKKQALDFIDKSLKESKGISKNGCKYFFYALLINIALLIIISILVSIFG